MTAKHEVVTVLDDPVAGEVISVGIPWQKSAGVNTGNWIFRLKIHYVK
jgi:hypothetical protein